MLQDQDWPEWLRTAVREWGVRPAELLAWSPFEFVAVFSAGRAETPSVDPIAELTRYNQRLEQPVTPGWLMPEVPRARPA